MTRPHPRTLVLYAYYETPEYRRNLGFFLRHGLDDRDELILVINGSRCTEPIPERPNLTVLRRANLGMDFGAWQEGLDGVDREAYDAFVFLNCTVRGPFLPVWAKSMSWTRLFTELLDEETRLVGTTVNYHYGHPHLQSMLLCTDREGLQVAYDVGIFGGDLILDKLTIGLEREIAFSAAVLRRGFRIRSMMAAYAQTDWRTTRGYHLAANAGGFDTVRPGDYFGTTPHPFEVLFVKSAAWQGTDLELLTAWADGGPPAGPLASCAFDLDGYEGAFHRIVPSFALVVGEPDDAFLDFLARLFDVWKGNAEANVHVLGLREPEGGHAAPHPRVRIHVPETAPAGAVPAGGGLVVVDAAAVRGDLEDVLGRHADLVAPGCFLVVDRAEHVETGGLAERFLDADARFVRDRTISDAVWLRRRDEPLGRGC
ncbi:MAG: hypothetical protein O2930_02800 [Acidobacteria bacterium]|nr:hypothetical protein [Acidobacteriota bacterium]